MKKNVQSVLIFILLGNLVLYSQVPHNRRVEFEHISIADGLSQSTIYCILQDSKGFMWFGTQAGLNRYDGYNFTIYTPSANDPGSISHGSVLRLYEDRGGTLWAGTSRGLSRFDREKETFTRFTHRPGDPHSLSRGSIWRIHEDRTGKLWVATSRGLNILDQETGKVTRIKTGPGNPGGIGEIIVQYILEDRSGGLWFTTVKGLYRYHHNDGTFTCYEHTMDGNKFEVLGMTEDRAGNIWLGTYGEGLKKFNPKTGGFIHYNIKPPNNPKALYFDYITAMCPDRDDPGIAWVGTVGGLAAFRPATGKVDVYCTETGYDGDLGNHYVQSIFQDRSGIVWVGTNGGAISKYDRRKQKFIRYRHRPGDPNSLAKDYVRSILEDRQGNLWVGTWGEGLDKFDRAAGTVTHYKSNSKTPGGICGNYIYGLVEDKQGNLWVGTRFRGLCKLDLQTETFTTFRHDANDPSSLSHNAIMTMTLDRDGVLWVGTFGGGLNRFNSEDGTFTAYRHDPGDPGSIGSDHITTLYTDRYNTIWVGTSESGVNRFHRDTGHFTRFTCCPGSLDCLNSNRILSIYGDSSGSMWFGTFGGLAKYDPETGEFNQYTIKDGLPDNVIYGILEDRQGNLWLSSNRGISRFDPVSGAFKNFGIRDGIQDYEFNARSSHMSKSGELFFGGLKGFNSFRPENILENPHVPPVVFTGFSVFNSPVPIGGDSPLQKHISETQKIVLTYRENIFSFQFSALDFAAPGENRFQYMLEGFNNKWIHLDTKHDVTFTNLDPGRYTLKVRGSNNDGVWNNRGASIEIVITPPFWRTWWFRLLVALAIAALILAWHNNRMNKLTLRLKTETEMQRIFNKYNVSNREQEIIQLMLKGKSNKDIEEELYISLKTVKNHVYNIYQKLGVKNRLELIHLIQRTMGR